MRIIHRLYQTFERSGWDQAKAIMIINWFLSARKYYHQIIQQ